jgi:hypothetical protein
VIKSHCFRTIAKADQDTGPNFDASSSSAPVYGDAMVREGEYGSMGMDGVLPPIKPARSCAVASEADAEALVPSGQKDRLVFWEDRSRAAGPRPFALGSTLQAKESVVGSCALFRYPSSTTW